ncbi:MAG: Ig-like domain repeat protein [Methanobrevibacter sp.]|uniref:Ig-like domain repeat protein n=1 Tax=Methanobrevibacter sp. TaxID=66852 RepID=UPI0025D083EE|nr:Ig-like domain repeat protein [Methanobrevibacter sp.]MBQ8018766.1 Ig-like domain repeat protein [Methanobrevibacter sp.]
MKLKYIFSFTIILITLLSMNFIFAGEVNENITLEINDDGDSIISDNYLNEDLSQKTTDNDPDSKLGNFEDGLTHVYVSPIGNGNGSSQDAPADFKTTLNSIGDNSVVHMMDGNYTWTCANKNDVISIKSKNNITIMAENSGKVMINSTSNYLSKEFNLDSSNNIIFKNIIFKGSYNADYLIYLKTCNNISIEGCSFIDFKYKSDVLASSKSSLNIRDCYFSNCSVGTNGIILQSNGEILIYNCTFDNVSKQIIKVLKQSNNFFKANISSCIFRELNGDSFIGIAGNPTVFENNTVQSSYNFELKVTGVGIINSSTTITVLDNTQLSATSGDVINITAVLVDDMGNYINIPKLDFSIDGVTYSATYKDGVYSVAYTVPEVTQPEEISFDSTPESTYLGDLTVKYQPLFLLAKPALNMTMSNVSDSVYGDNVTVKVNISNLESGNLIYQFIKDDVVVKTVTDSFSNNMSTVSVNDLPAGDYTVAIKYAEDDNFGATTITKTFTVSKANSTVQILIDPTIPVGDNITVQAIVPANAGGNVTFRLNTDNKTVNVTDKAVFDSLANGTYIIYAVYNGDDNYNPSEESNITFEVVKVNPTISIEYSTPVINENVTVTVTMNEDINGDVNVTINKLDPVVEHVVNGTLVFNITNVPYGPQNITVGFTGNDKYNAGEKNASFFVNKLDLDLSISADEITYGDPLVVIVNANEKFTGEVIVKIGTLNQTVNVVNGKGNATFNNLTADDYFINATFTGDETFNADSANTTATVKGVEVPATQAFTTNVPANTKSPTFSIKLEKDATGTFTVNIDNGKIVKTAELKDGAASITVVDLTAGDHKISISYSGDGKYAPITQNTTLNIKEPVKPTPKVTKKATKIVAKKKTFKAKKKTKKYTITLKSGKKAISKVKVTIKVGKKTYTAKTNKKGKATFNLKKLTKKGKYTAVIKFKGNKNYKATSKKVKITVKK